MKHDTVVNIAGSINTMAMILLILINLSKNIGIDLKISCWMWISILLFSVISIIFKFITENNRYYIFLLATLNANLLVLVEVSAQALGKEGGFIDKESIAVLIELFLIVISSKTVLSRNIFLSRCIVLSFLVALAGCYINAFRFNIVMVIGVLICIIYAIVVMLINDIREKILANVDISSKVIGVIYACMLCASIIALMSTQLNLILTLFMPSITITIAMYVFRKEIMTKLKEFGIILIFVYPLITFSLPLAFLIQAYSNYSLYKLFIAVLLIISAVILLVISSDNINNVVRNNIEKSYLERKFSKVRMFIGNTTVFFTILSVVIDNFYNELKEVIISLDSGGMAFILAVWLVGGLISILFIYIEEKFLRKIVKVIRVINEKNGNKMRL